MRIPFKQGVAVRTVSLAKGLASATVVLSLVACGSGSDGDGSVSIGLEQNEDGDLVIDTDVDNDNDNDTVPVDDVAPIVEAPSEPIVVAPAPEIEAPSEPIVVAPAPEIEAPSEPIVVAPVPEEEAPPEPIVEAPAPEEEAPPEPIVEAPAPEEEAPPEPIVEAPAPEVEAPPEPIVEAPAPEEEAPPEPIVSLFQQIQDNIFTPTCVECHAGIFAPVGLQLEDGIAFSQLVGVTSFEVSELNRVSPGDPDNSYLVQKIEGTQAVGGQMPLGGPPLSQELMDLVRQWISEGALPDTTVAAAFAARVVSASIDDNESLDGLPATVSLVWSSEVDQSSFDDTTVTLVGSGGDSSFDDGNEVSVTMSRTDSSSGFVTQFATGSSIAADDAYELRISGSGDIYAVAVDAAPIDGDDDGVAGGDFVRNFTVD